jgi:hypothetical protein
VCQPRQHDFIHLQGWQLRAEQGTSSVPIASPLSHPDGGAVESSGIFRGFRPRRVTGSDTSHATHSSATNNGLHSLGSSRQRMQRHSWDGSEGDRAVGGMDRGLRDSLNSIAEEGARSDTSQGAYRPAARHRCYVKTDYILFSCRFWCAVPRHEIQTNMLHFMKQTHLQHEQSCTRHPGRGKAYRRGTNKNFLSFGMFRHSAAVCQSFITTCFARPMCWSMLFAVLFQC